MLETQLHLVNGVVALLAAAIPIYLTLRLNNNLRQLTAILSIFIISIFWSASIRQVYRKKIETNRILKRQTSFLARSLSQFIRFISESVDYCILYFNRSCLFINDREYMTNTEKDLIL